ncbi:MAG: Na+/H+ antiporter NhaC family protein [Anaerovoracaceae bacterium]
MDIIIGFAVFMVSMIGCLIWDLNMIIGLVIGLISFLIVGMFRGFTFRQVLGYAYEGAKESLLVIKVMLLIGIITATWRACGTITFFVYYGVKVITPPLFVVITFLLASLLAYALGTSFGVVGTLGVIFMALARSGGVNEIITAGAIMSGIYFGDRNGPASSSANLVAIITKTDLFENIRMMLKTAVIPMGICLVLYGILSFGNPINQVDENILSGFTSEFKISYWLALPAGLMLVLPLLKVNVIRSLTASIAAGVCLTLVLQGTSITETIKFLILGYKSGNADLAPIINGGGMVSMIEVCGIVVISCAYSGLFNNTNMLDSIQRQLENMSSRIGRFGAMIVVSLLSCMIFCNQTVASMLCNDLLAKPYEDAGATREELAIDIENSVIVLAGIVPWCVACSFPLKTMGVGIETLLFSFFIYLMPITYAFTKKIWYNIRL